MTTSPAESAAVKLPDEQLIEITNYLQGSSLVRGRDILCPKCEVAQDILAYQSLHFVDKYAEHLVPVMKCRRCRHTFALRP